MNSNYLEYVKDCSNKGEEPLTEQQYNFCTEDKDWFVFEGGTYKQATKEQKIAMYTKCIREEFPDCSNGLPLARLKKEGDLLPWWQQPLGFREGKIEEPHKTFIRSIGEFEDKIDSTGFILVTKGVLKGILNKLMKIERESTIKDGIEYYVLKNDEVSCYIELLT